MVRLLEKKKSPVSVLTIFAIVSFGLHILVLLLFIFQGTKINQLSWRKQPNFVQMVDGNVVNETDDLGRDSEVIRQFVSKTMSSIFNWSGSLPPQTIEEVGQPKPDLGILIKTPTAGSQRVTTSSWLGSFAVSEDFRKGFLSQIAAMTPPEVFATNPQQVISGELRIKRVYPPKQIDSRRWSVGMVADLIQQKKADGHQVIIPFNKDLLVRAVDYFDYPAVGQTTVLQSAIYRVRADRLEIYELRNLCLIDAYDNESGARSDECVGAEKSGSFIR